MLAMAPQPWRVSLLLEVLYGGRTLVGERILFSITARTLSVMLMVFNRRYYDKALLVILSTFLYWKKNNHPMYNLIRQALVAFDEYSVEIFHSVLRGRTNATDDANQTSLKAKEIDASKHKLHLFKPMVVPRKSLILTGKLLIN